MGAVFNPSMNREVFEKQLCNQSSQYEKIQSVTKRKSLHETTESMSAKMNGTHW